MRQDTYKHSSQSESSLNEFDEIDKPVLNKPTPSPRKNAPNQTQATIHSENPKHPTEFNHISL